MRSPLSQSGVHCQPQVADCPDYPGVGVVVVGVMVVVGVGVMVVVVVVVVVRPGSPATSSGHPPGPKVQPVTGRHTTALPSVCDAPPAGTSPSGSGPESLR